MVGQSIGPHQHFVHSIYRAIESGKYVLRSANNGITAIVNPLGVVEEQVDLNQSGFIDLFKTKKIEPTIFSKYGNKIFALIILFIFGFLLYISTSKIFKYIPQELYQFLSLKFKKAK